MSSKWTVYILTFITYATFHSIRSAWSGLKNMFYDPPFDYSVDFLGLIDMMVVFTLAISLSTLGHRVERYGAKKCLLIGMGILIVNTLIIGVLLVSDVTSKGLYIILYGFGIGIFSATGWPACLYLLSQYFDKKSSTSLPIWNGTSQFGDFLALFISDIIIQGLNADVSITLIIIPIIMSIVIIFNLIYLPKDKIVEEIEDRPKDAHQLNEEKANQEKSQSEKSKISNKNIKNPKTEEIVKNQIEQKPIQSIIKDEIEVQKVPSIVIQNHKIQNADSNKEVLRSNEDEISNKQSSIKQTGSRLSQANLEVIEHDTTPVDFFNVWCLPGVALYVLANAIIKSINAIIMTWLVFYLSLPEMDMKDQSRVIAILWTFGVFGGSIIGGKINPTYSKRKFIVCLFIAAAMFMTLENMHEKIYEIQIAIAIVICSLAFGVPYNMLNTAVPIMLGQRQEIKHRPGAKSAIISIMEGFGMGLCAFSILLVPLIGVDYIHWVLSIYCIISILTLTTAIFMQKPHKNLPTASDTDRQQKGSMC